MVEPNAQRGRPPLADTSVLREQAIGILLRDGYASRTMLSLAEELGLSVRTLHRYFPTKADIIWGGTEHAVDTLRRHLDATPQDISLLAAITIAVKGVFAADVDEPSLNKTRLRAIAATSHIQSTRPEAYRGWREETVAFIAHRTGKPQSDVTVRAAGAAVQVAVAEALAYWADTGSHDDLGEIVTQALTSLDLLTSTDETARLTD
ncbi:TetR/AcrR family transcriptional regulator [Tsukamurella tyrosinosolvens]|uniref:TetR/AcrR family transcriptional regulator n=1 Tax=Tsukamurella tyrosinosolvens TaxID=57704 RepID=UPI000CA342B2|nr:TetR/AcrR family transcriptional regulator [Tsukamurella tyrosinosolvens]AUN41858.1 hypothetical protein ASU32_19150 [Tsukamurella tyrosinosolvens]